MQLLFVEPHFEPAPAQNRRQLAHRGLVAAIVTEEDVELVACHASPGPPLLQEPSRTESAALALIVHHPRLTQYTPKESGGQRAKRAAVVSSVADTTYAHGFLRCPLPPTRTIA